MNKPGRWLVILLLVSWLLPVASGKGIPPGTNQTPFGPGHLPAAISREKKVKSTGYRALIPYKDGFLAAGTGGRIDRLSLSGELIQSETLTGVNFNCLCTDGERIIAGGDNGMLLISEDKGIFRKVDSGTNSNIHSLVFCNGKIIAAADHGEIIMEESPDLFRKIKPGVKGNLVSVSARSSACFGVTDEGEIIHSLNGKDWDVLDFNRVYSGYYKPCRFTRILATEKRIAVAGYRENGSAVLMFSNQGNVWTERLLNFTDDQGIPDYLFSVPNDILYDEKEDQYFLACNDGKLLKLPSCSHCNRLTVVTVDDLEGISSNENTLMIVGANFLIRGVKIR